MEFFANLPGLIEQAATIGAVVVTSASAIAAVTPTKKDDEVLGKGVSLWSRIRAVIEVLALNVLNAKPRA